jgi:phage/plasmid-like protein (TIGR03299 family)
MAHQIDTVSIGRASYASTQREWHGLGELMPAGQDIDTWAKAAGMEYKVQRASIRYATSRMDEAVARIGELNKVEDKIVLFRSDTGAPLGVVSDSYKVVQPREVLEVFREWADASGLTIESAGVLFGGKRYFATAKIQEAIGVDGLRDQIVPYVLLSTSADGSLATEGRWTAVRTVCNNTLSMARQGATAFRLTHRSKWDPEAFKRVIEGANEEFSGFMTMARALTDIKLSVKEAEDLTTMLLTTGQRNADAARESAGFNRIMSLFDGQGRGATLETARETGWGWLNAVTEYVDHHARARSDENRLVSALWGPGDDLKNKARDLVTAVV